jgi:hypothetical protein
MATVNRRTLDLALPMLYAAIIVAVALLANGTAVTVVAVVGAMLLGIYYAALRRNLR